MMTCRILLPTTVSNGIVRFCSWTQRVGPHGDNFMNLQCELCFKRQALVFSGMEKNTKEASKSAIELEQQLFERALYCFQ